MANNAQKLNTKHYLILNYIRGVNKKFVHLIRQKIIFNILV